jgi:hypothetical protein
MPVGRILLGLAGVAALTLAAFVVALVVNISTSAGGGCGGG